MALLDGLFKKKYTTNCWCNNCSNHQEVQIPRGVTVTQFVESGTGKCLNCGCNTLVADYEQIDEFRKPLVPKNSTQQKVQQNVQRPRMKFMKHRPAQPQPQQVERAPLPRPRPTTKPMHYQPLPKKPDFEPQKIFKQPPVDYWTGKPLPPEETETEEEGDYENN